MAASVVLVLVLALAAGGWAATALGGTDPGAVVRVGTPLLRVITDAAAALCVGALAFAVFFTRPREQTDTMPGTVRAPGYRALLAARRWSLVWLVASATLTVFSAAQGAGLPLGRITSPDALVQLVRAQEAPLGWAAATCMVSVVALASRVVIRWRSTAVLLGWALLCVLPPLAAGHSSSDANHDYATAAIWVHVPVALVWIGVLPMVLDRVRRGGADLAAVLRRYDRLAWLCFTLLLLSGLVDAAVLSPSAALGRYDYVQVLAVKLVLVAALVAGTAWLRRAVRRLDRSRAVRGLVRVCAAELVLLLAALGCSVELTQLPPPAFLGPVVSIDQTLLGYNLTAPPTLLRLGLDWRIEVLFAGVALVLAGGYLLALRRLRRAGTPWPVGHTAGWLAGCLVLLIATSSGLGRYASAQFSIHMAGHMLVAFVAPMLLVQGAPLTLARTAAQLRPGREDRQHLPSSVDWVGLLDRSPLARALTHPIVALALLVGSPFLLYFTSAFDEAARFHWAGIALDAYFLVVGYLFAWLVIGTDPPPRPLPNLARLGMLLAATPFTTVFAALVMTDRSVIGNGYHSANMYTALDLPWVHSLLGDQRLAGELALGIGEAALFAAVVVLLLRWSRVDDDPLASGLPDATRLLAGAQRRAGAPPSTAAGPPLAPFTSQAPLQRAHPLRGWRSKRLSRRLLETTNSDDIAIVAPATSGLSSPAAASGIAATL